MPFLSKRASAVLRSSFISISLFAVGHASADQHTTGAPLESSRPAATYTLFLDPAGFNFSGTWGSGSTPGNNLGLNNALASGTFTADDINEINAIYASMANEYRSFNVNVTTVDPALAALGAGATDTQRQAYYDSQAHMMHTVIGAPGTPGWNGTADGLALLGVIGSAATSNGAHTNFMFSDSQNGTPTVANGTYIGDISAHEGGHTFGLHHQSDYTGATLVNEYTNGDTATDNGSYVATMGNASARQRVAWRVGSSNGGTINDENTGTSIENQQNDVKTILSNDAAVLVDSGIGHTFATATAIPLVGTAIDVSSPLHRGIISPASAASPNPIGVSNYTHDVFSFRATGTGIVTLTANDGNDLLSPGVADPSVTLRSTMEIFDSSFNPVAVNPLAVEDPSTLSETFTGLLAAGVYYAEIDSFGGHTELSGFNPAQYYDMGGYFLTGSGFAAVPEPTTLGFVAFGMVSLFGRRRA